MNSLFKTKKIYILFFFLHYICCQLFYKKTPKAKTLKNAYNTGYIFGKLERSKTPLPHWGLRSC